MSVSDGDVGLEEVGELGGAQRSGAAVGPQVLHLHYEMLIRCQQDEKMKITYEDSLQNLSNTGTHSIIKK